MASEALRRRLRRGSATAVALGTLLLSGCATTNISASPGAGGYEPFLPEVTSEDAGLRESFEKSPQETHEFWNDPNKVGEADGLQFTPPDNVPSNGAGDPATGAFMTATSAMPDSPQGLGDLSEAQLYDRAGLGASTFGRFYFTFDGNEMGVCSATIVNSSSGRVMVTAAHCVMNTDGSQKIAQSAIFVPGDRNDLSEAPYGVWAAVDVFVPQEFADSARTDASGQLTSEAGWNFDFAFVTLEQQQGASIQSTTGGQGIAFGVPVNTLTQIGYPSAPPFDGRDEFVCASTSYSTSWQGGFSITSNMTPGSSGGAWLSDYDRTSGTGFVVGVTSTIDRYGRANSPALGETALSLYKQADASV